MTNVSTEEIEAAEAKAREIVEAWEPNLAVSDSPRGETLLTHSAEATLIEAIAAALTAAARVRSASAAENYRCYECNGDLYGPYCPTCNPSSPSSDAIKAVVEALEAKSDFLDEVGRCLLGPQNCNLQALGKNAVIHAASLRNTLSLYKASVPAASEGENTDV